MNLKQVRDTIVGLLILFLLVVGVVKLYNHAQSKVHRDLAKRMAELSPHGGPPTSIDGLRQAIALYETQIELNVKEGVQTGVYWKILAIRYADKSMHRDALAALEHAMYYNADDPTLFYLTGESATIVAANALQFSVNTPSEKKHFQELAEQSYLRAIALDNTYAKPLLGIGVLYVFDMNKPDEAIPYLLKYLDQRPNDLQTMFIIARAYYMTEQYALAVPLYDKIIERTKDPTVKAEAQNNRDIVRALMYGEE